MSVAAAAELAEDLEADAYEAIDETKDAVIQFVREQPMTALIVTFLVGVLIGKVIL
ncbi:MAG: hypothetical protein WDN01_00855 [Rhizomicrobium sp.]